jgi:hypothetical protein
MNDLLGQVKRIARERWTRVKVRGAARRLREREVDLAIERLVDQADPRLRALSGYRRKLFDAVSGCLDYCGDLAQRIPGPRTLDHPSWGADPVLNALFGDWERVRQVISSREVRRYTKETALKGGDCFAVLVVLPILRNQLGIGARLERVRLDRMNVVREDGDPSESQEIELLRGYRADHPGRVLLLIRFRREDLIPDSERLAEVERFLIT